MLHILAKNSYESKEDLKDNGFLWDKEAKAWVKDFESEDEYNQFVDKFMNVSYYGRHTVNKYHSKVVFEIVKNN